MKTFSKVLVANRGEIAVRVMRTAKQFGLRTVAVHSTADAQALHVQSADEAVCIGGPAPNESYLRADKVIAAAKRIGADAIHPGYGFLSENAGFAELCEKEGIVFIGPGVEAIRLMGSKRLSKVAMLEHGVPCIPGYQGVQQDDATLLEKASEVGLPLMIKASAGGGGRGMRLVFDEADIQSQLDAARTEAAAAFGSDELILERALIEPRHIEIQVFADAHGNVVYLGERDCSIQRRHQKVIEESPSPYVDDALRQRMGEAAVNAAKSCDYRGAGTVEFLVDQDKNFYFLEMNTRLQVEHPVTELVTGLDLVEWQLLVADGQKLPLEQDQIKYNGHAIEARICAEDPRQNYLPQAGQIFDWSPAHGQNIRVDSGVQSGQAVSPFYDSMLAKMICWSPTREGAALALANALQDSVLLGVNNNMRFLQTVLRTPAFIEGHVTTAFLNKAFSSVEEVQASTPSTETLALAAMLLYRDSRLGSPGKRSGWSVASPAQSHYLLGYAGEDSAVAVQHVGDAYSVQIERESFEFLCSVDDVETRCEIHRGDHRMIVNYVVERTAFDKQVLFLDDGSGHYEIHDETYRPATSVAGGGDALLKAAMDGAIVDVKVAVGERVKAGQILVVLEAMKMAHQLKAGIAGVVQEVLVEIGQQVKTRQLLLKIDGETDSE